MTVDLSNQVVVAVTGASSGIGEATAPTCAEAAAAVALAARRSDRIDAPERPDSLRPPGRATGRFARRLRLTD
jgi:NAD(P)-dependent dehydrogenase (short-subunit alcohol dehydrogenase family)